MSMLQYRNNWYAHEYTVDGKRVTPTKVHVGGVGTFNVEKKEEHGTYMDMGHNYDYRTYQFHIVLDSPFGDTLGPSLKELLEKGYVIQVIND